MEATFEIAGVGKHLMPVRGQTISLSGREFTVIGVRFKLVQDSDRPWIKYPGYEVLATSPDPSTGSG